MLRRMTLALATLSKLPRPFLPAYQPRAYLNCSNYSLFSQQKDLTPVQMPSEGIQGEEITIGDEKIDFYRTEGGISIMDKVPGVKSQSGQLYVLSYRCGECDTQSIKSFTKHAYHKGVVLVRCDGCDNTHLVADNLGWFQDEPVNVETMYGVKKVHDHNAIMKFLNTAFEDHQPIQSKTPSESGQNKEEYVQKQKEKESVQEQKKGE